MTEIMMIDASAKVSKNALLSMPLVLAHKRSAALLADLLVDV
jgi:hypothetical protein